MGKTSLSKAPKLRDGEAVNINKYFFHSLAATMTHVLFFFSVKMIAAASHLDLSVSSVNKA